MADIQIHTEHASAKNVLSEAVQAEKNRIGYALQLGKKKISFFEENLKFHLKYSYVTGQRKNWKEKISNILNGQVRQNCTPACRRD